MVPFHNPEEYVYNLYTTSSSEAKRLWKKHIKESWENNCAYCGSEHNLTIDHVIPQSKGGMDNIKNVVCCCKDCNHDKGHTYWEDWYFSQDFFSYENYQKIKEWVMPEKNKELYSYKKRRNNAS